MPPAARIPAATKGDVAVSDADCGTIMRFVERVAESESFLPGIAPAVAAFVEGEFCCIQERMGVGRLTPSSV